MSADAEIASLLSYASSSASSLASQSNNLVNSAVAALAKTVKIPAWNSSFGTEVGVDYGESGVPGFAGEAVGGSTGILKLGGSTGILKSAVQAFPAWPILTFAAAPATQEIDRVSDEIEVEFPDLSLPSFSRYRNIGELAAFTKSSPVISTTVDVPEAPDTEVPYEMTLLGAAEIDDPDAIELVAPELIPVTTDEVNSSDYTTLYDGALAQFRGVIEGSMNAALASSSSWCDAVLDDVLDAVLTALLARLTTPTMTVLADQAHADLVARLNERLETERARVDSLVSEDRSGWDLPAAVRQAMAATLDQIRRTRTQTVQAGFYTKTIELALAEFEVFGSALAALSSGIASLYEKAIGLLFEAHEQSLAAAKQTVTSLLKFHDLYYVQTQQLNTEIAEAKLLVVEQQLTVALVAFEIAKVNLEVESAKLERDDIAIAVLKAEARKAELDANLYATQVTAVRAELEAIKLPSDLFKAQVQAFDARIDAHRAQVECRVADIEGDTAKLQGKLIAVKEFESRAAAFEKTIAAKSQISQAQASRNDAVIAEFEARVKGVIASLTQTAMTDQYELQKYEVLADDVLSDARIAEKNARARLQFAIHKQDAIREAFKFSQERALELMKTELDRTEAIATVNESGAGIMANMALSAMSIANGIAHTIITESA